MKPLEKTVNKNGYTYNLLKRNNVVALYEQIDKEVGLVGHEVFEVIVLPEKEMFGKYVPEREKFPVDNDFGVTAFSVGKDLDVALSRFDKLTKEITNRPNKDVKM